MLLSLAREAIIKEIQRHTTVMSRNDAQTDKLPSGSRVKHGCSMKVPSKNLKSVMLSTREQSFF